MTSGSAGGKVIQMCRIIPGPSISASTTRSPGSITRYGAPLRPPAAAPPAPRAPVGFSKLIDRLATVGATTDRLAAGSSMAVCDTSSADAWTSLGPGVGELEDVGGLEQKVLAPGRGDQLDAHG